MRVLVRSSDPSSSSSGSYGSPQAAGSDQSSSMAALNAGTSSATTASSLTLRRSSRAHRPEAPSFTAMVAAFSPSLTSERTRLALLVQAHRSPSSHCG